MAYQNIGTPRFYVNGSHFMIANDAGNVQPINAVLGSSHDGWDNGIAMLNIGKDYEITEYGNFPYQSRTDFPISGNYNFCFILGHNIAAVNSSYFLWDTTIGTINATSGVNFTPVGYNGWTLHIFDEQPPHEGKALFHIESGYATGITKIKSVCIGKYYDMPNAPNLSLTMSREYGGTKEFTTYNGSSMSNTMWSKAPKWGDLGAWELGSENPALSRSGRRTWQLKFSFMDDGDLWGPNQLMGSARYDDTTGYDLGDLNDDNYFEYNILTDDNFFSQVWHKTQGLPFIFQPDSSNSNPDQFCIARFKDNSLKATQSALNLYDISLSIEETW